MSVAGVTVPCSDKHSQPIAQVNPPICRRFLPRVLKDGSRCPHDKFISDPEAQGITYCPSGMAIAFGEVKVLNTGE